MVKKFLVLYEIIMERYTLKFYKFFILLITLFFINTNLFSKNQVRIKDIILIDGLRENQLMGIGLITGLNGRGDSNNFKLTGKMLLNLAANHGYNINSAVAFSRVISCTRHMIFMVIRCSIWGWIIL